MVLRVHVCVAFGGSTALLRCKEIWRAVVSDVHSCFHGVLFSMVFLAIRHTSTVCRNSGIEKYVSVAISCPVCTFLRPGPAQETGRVECALQQPCYDMDFGDYLHSLRCPDSEFKWLSNDL